MPRYINPYTDFGFKKLFGEEANKDLLIDFLNAVLPPENHIADLTFNNPEQLPNNIVDRKAIFDISCTGSNGSSFTVEMQKVKQYNFKDRGIFLLSYPIQRQAQKGNWDFKLNPVFLVAVLDFLYDEEVERQKLYRHAMMKDQDGEVFSKTIQMVFLQMPLFTLSESELVTRKDKWLYFLKNLESFDEIPRILREPVFEKAFDTAEYIRMPPKMQDAYFASWKAYLDNVNTFQYALDQAQKEGMEKGMEKGLAEGEERGMAKGMEKGLAAGHAAGHAAGRDEGKAEGIAEGLEKGESKRSIEIARNMKAMGLSTDVIAKATGLDAKDIELLR